MERQQVEQLLDFATREHSPLVRARILDAILELTRREARLVLLTNRRRVDVLHRPGTRKELLAGIGINS